jgi:DedD protein
MSLKDSADPQASVQAVPAAPMPVATSATEPLPPTQPVAPAPTEAAPAPSAAAAEVPPAKGIWWAQLDTFSVRGNAERLGRQLRAAGFAIEVSKINVQGKELYRVRAGPVRDRAEALALQSRLKANGNKSLLVAP